MIINKKIAKQTFKTLYYNYISNNFNNIFLGK